MSDIINVDFDGKKFVIHAPFFALSKMRAIPNRRFEKKLNNAWTAPPLRANVKYLQSALPSNTTFTPTARAKMTDILELKMGEGLPFPRDYKFVLPPYDHQMQAMHWAYGKQQVALFMDMRTGKTKVVIDLGMAMHADGLLERALVVPLLTLRKNWQREFMAHAEPEKLDIHLLDTSKKKAFDQFNSRNDGRLKVLLTGIESMSAGGAIDMALDFCAGPKTMAAVDESDSIKNGSTARAQNMFLIREKTEYRLILTGTPISKGPMDFFSQFEFLDPNIIGIGDYFSFRNRYAIMGGYEDKEVVGYQNMEELIELTKPYVHQVRYTDVFKSPPAVFEERTVELTKEQRAIYKSIKKDGSIRSDGDIKLVVQNVLEKMLRLQEVCGGFWAERLETGEFTTDPTTMIRKPKFKYKHYPVPGKNPKIDCLIDVLTREFVGEQGIVWAIHRDELQLIADSLAPHGGVRQLHGGVSEEDRDALDRDFRAGRFQWIVANPQTGARGYTFDAATVMVNFTYSHNFIDRAQSMERATSGKKTKPVMVVDIVAENTVEEGVLEALTMKKNVGEFVRSALEGKRRGIDELLVG